MSKDQTWRRPHQVYILRAPEFETPTFKIGASSNPRLRCSTIQRVHKTPMELVAAYHAGRSAHSIEKFWHGFFWPKRVATKGPYCREWFHLTDWDVRFLKHACYRMAAAARDGRDHRVFGRVNFSDFRKRVYSKAA